MREARRNHRGAITRWVVAIVMTLTSMAAGTAAGAPVQAQLAAKPLPSFPWARFVRCFGPGESPSLAVDTTRWPHLAGQTCDVYVVEARTSAEWDSDPSLIDIRPGGPASVTFAPGTLTGNLLPLIDSELLDADAGIGLGVPYDVVLDCDRDGLLGSPDTIDGSGEEAGLYAVRDTTRPGPLTPVEVVENLGPLLTRKTYYPAEFSSLGPMPLVSIGHGWMLEYWYYDYIGRHLASYGYVVVSHANDVGDGDPAATETASESTLVNIDYTLGNLDTLVGGVLDGRVDGERIVMIGHSTGGEGVVRAYTRLRDNPTLATNFSADDVALLAPIAPVAWLGPDDVDPGDVNFHMFGGAADIDTGNHPYPGYVQLFTIYERAQGNRQATYIHGAGHMDFHSAGGDSWAEGPDLIGRPATHDVVRGYLIPLLARYVRGNPAARDYYERMYDDFHPAGISDSVIVVTESRTSRQSGNVVLDDLETNPALTLASGGGVVQYDVDNVAEPWLSDTDLGFNWTGFQPSNGMTRARWPGEAAVHGVVFDWPASPSRFYEIGVPPAQRDFTDDMDLSFRIAQGTRHPITDTVDGPLTFSVTLVDGAGASSTIRTDNYGGVSRPYKRTGFGAGAGWANEFNTIRLRLDDFRAEGSPIDLADVVAVRFEFGLAHGSRAGRVGLDDVELTAAGPRAPFELRAVEQSGVTRLEWTPRHDAADYDLYRGSIPPGGLAERGSGIAVYDHVCFEAGDAAGDGRLVANDAATPPAGEGRYYIVGTRLGDGSLDMGVSSIDLDLQSSGDQRDRPVNSPCP